MKRLLMGVFIILAVVGIYSYLRPLPAVQASPSVLPPKVSETVDLPWPAYGQGALAAQGFGMLQTHGEQKSVPMASIAKVITALAVLKQKPMAVGQPGPN